MSRRQSPRNTPAKILIRTSKPGPFQQLVSDLAEHRRKKSASTRILIGLKQKAKRT